MGSSLDFGAAGFSSISRARPLRSSSTTWEGIDLGGVKPKRILPL
jgi:hypothetical protein